MTNTTKRLREQAEQISNDRAQALADVEGYESLLVTLDPDLGAKDVQEIRDRLREAEARLDRLAEEEHHAWDAYQQASQDEHYEYLREQDNDYR